MLYPVDRRGIGHVETVLNGSVSEVTYLGGYRIITADDPADAIETADDPADAIETAKGCPVLTLGGTIAVSDCIEV
ncbi:MAG: hypothetical protein GY812_04235 [Actinomycetia bacterium]|nr:hypothetical protein [Actinomycetes bacterium]